jgi:hypothetical protein
MAGVLTALARNPTVSAENIAKPFGFKAPFAQRYKAWLNKASIISGNKLTGVGEIIFEKDPKLELLTTQWFIHHELTKDPNGAESWYFFIREFLPSRESFKRDELEFALGQKLMGHSVEHFSKGRPMNKKISRKLLDCYLQKEALGELNFLEKEGQDLYIVKTPDSILGPWTNVAALKREY